MVSTIAGDGKRRESRDGVGITAGLDRPRVMIESFDGKSLIFVEEGSNRIRTYRFSDGRVSTLLGTGAKGFENGDSKSAAFQFPYSLCADPLKRNNLYIGDYTSIRYWDSATDQVTLIAGDEKGGFVDGVGSNARFCQIAGLLCHPNGKTLFVCDSENHRIRKVDLTSRTVTTIAGDGKHDGRDGSGMNCSIFAPQQLGFDRSANVTSNSVLFITSFLAIRRFDISTGILTTLFDGPTYCTRKGLAINEMMFDSLRQFSPCGLVNTPSGHLIVSCNTTSSLFLIDPSVPAPELIRVAGAGKDDFGIEPIITREFGDVHGLVVAGSDRCLYVSDSWTATISRITLPAQLFVAPALASPVSPSGVVKVVKSVDVHAPCKDRQRELVKKLESMNGFYHRKKAELEKISLQLGSVTERKESAERLTTELTKANDKAEAELESERAKSSQLQSTVDSLSTQLADSQHWVDNQSQQLEAERATTADLTARCTHLTNELDLQSKQLESERLTITEWSAHCASITNELTALKQQLKRQSQQQTTLVDQYKSADQRLRYELNAERAKTTKLQSQIQTHNEQFGGVSRQLDVERSKSTALSGQNQFLTNKVASLNDEIRSMTDQLQRSRTGLNEECTKTAELESQLRARNEQFEVQRRQLEVEQSQSAELSSRCDGFTNEVASLTEEIQFVTAQFHAESRQRIDLISQLKAAESLVTELRRERTNEFRPNSSLERSQIEAELKSVWAEITRISRQPRNVIEIGAVGQNATSIKGVNRRD